MYTGELLFMPDSGGQKGGGPTGAMPIPGPVRGGQCPPLGPQEKNEKETQQLMNDDIFIILIPFP